MKIIQYLINTSQGNCPKVWKIFSNLLRKTNLSNFDLIIIDDVITDSQKISDSFTNYFNIIPGALSESIISNIIQLEHYLGNAVPEQPIFNPVDQNTVNAITNGLENENSTGWDIIPTNAIKAISRINLAPLTKLINKSLQKAIVPDALEIAKISPT